MRSTRRLAATLALLALLGACQSPEPETPTATIAAPTPPAADLTPTAPPPPTPSPTPEDYTVPAVIDEPYVQRILTALYDLESEAARQMVAAGGVTGEAESIIRSIVRSDLADRDMEAYRAGAAEGFPGVLRPPGNQRIAVEEILANTSACLFVRVDRDFTEVLSDPQSQAGDTFVQLLPKPEGQVPTVNPTPWIIGGSALRTDGQSPVSPCV